MQAEFKTLETTSTEKRNTNTLDVIYLGLFIKNSNKLLPGP